MNQGRNSLWCAAIVAFSFALPACGRAEDLWANQPCDGKAAPVDGRFDHSAFDALLKRYVDASGMVDYRTWKEKDAARLDAYLDAAGCVDPSKLASDDERLAFFINVYNAVTIKGILHFYPTKSIREHTADGPGFNLWKNFYFRSPVKNYSLDAIENEVLRKMGEPRIHFGIVCASIGCPKLRNEAYVGSRVRDQLQDQGVAFFKDPSKFRLEAGDGRVSTSSILDWFGSDFGSDENARLKFIARFVEGPAKATLEKGGLKFKFLDYDWSLNEQRK
ncbi:MAG: DUF547 domain-containing protein [Planctomycetes bacterium]|nr:DUF547 domain-containing protein [Planctomycetota bacterium]MBI3846872.1 DUF547 domain-containing protein [Planctomycetota bacterium]